LPEKGEDGGDEDILPITFTSLPFFRPWGEVGVWGIEASRVKVKRKFRSRKNQEMRGKGILKKKPQEINYDVGGALVGRKVFLRKWG